ncbi:hypothetical protein WMF45_05670 [Sorangium sp. So ce448]|uniref:hypothetical protein n=1 Tax=Sorangium sp. So ce448 TaxID=3133314 RepID=UPI003F5DBA4C
MMKTAISAFLMCSALLSMTAPVCAQHVVSIPPARRTSGVSAASGESIRCEADAECNRGESCEKGACVKTSLGETMDAVRLSADIVFRPEDIKEGGYVLPAVTGAYRKSIIGSDIYQLDFAVAIALQPPALNSLEASAAARRVLLSGGDGTLDLAFKASLGSFESKFFVIVDIRPHIGWAAPKSVSTDESDTRNTMGIFSGQASLSALLGVIYLGAQYQITYPFAAPADDIVAKNMTGSSSITILGALKVNFAAKDDASGKGTDYFLQGRFLKSFGEMENALGPDTSPGVAFDLRLVGSFAPL